MSGSAQLVPVTTSAPLATPPKSRALSPTAPLARLAQPLHVIDPGNGTTIYYYIKVAARRGAYSLRNLPPEVARQVAMVVVNRSTQRFTLHWHPNQEAPQVVEDLPFSALAQAVDDLCNAGFAAQSSTPSASAPTAGATATSPALSAPALPAGRATNV